MQLKPNQVVLGKYKIEKLLGSGALGDVYRAEDLDLERKVAVKHLKPEYAADEEALKRFREEARTIAKLRHHNIAVVYGLEQEEGQCYIIMEHAEEGTLADFVAEKDPLPIIQAIDLAIALSHALTAVHKKGILHRDIKSSNILLVKLDDKLVPRLSDFGLSSISKSDSYFGTLQYAPPEQLQGHQVDARSDVYSLGVVLYEMLTGSPPYTGNKDEILHAQLGQGPPLLRSTRKGVLPSLERVVLKALFKQPEDRYQTTRAMAEDLERARRKELEKKEKIRHLRTQADQYIRSQNWLEAVQVLEEASSLDPNYEDTTQQLKEARTQMTLETTYKQGSDAFSREDWTEARDKFREIHNIDETYRDVADKLQEIEKKVHLHSLYTEARLREEREEWSEAIRKYAQIIAIDSGYKDAAKKLAESAERNRLQLLYDQAQALFDDKNWQQAAEKFCEVLALDPQYEDAASKAEEAGKHAQSQILCTEGMKCLESEEWDRAIATFEKIRQSDSGYGDVDARLKEAERQKSWQDLLDQGLSHLGRKNWQEAIEKFTQLLSENPEHYTAATLLEEASRRQAHEKARTRRSEENPTKAWWSSQHPTVKAASIGAAATILVALCGFLGGDTTREIVRHLLGTSASPAPVVTSMPSFTPTGTPYPAPALVSPDQGKSFASAQEVKLQWEWEQDLAENEFFEARIRLKGEQKFDPMDLTKVPYQFVPASKLIQSGTYEWQVAVVSLSGEEKGASQIWSFEVR